MNKKTTTATPISKEAPVSTLSRLIRDVPSTRVFAGWGPRIEV